MTILALGPVVAEALSAAEALAAQGLSAGVVNLRFLKPLDEELILSAAAKTGRLLTAEDNALAGGLFGAVAEILSRTGTPALLQGLGLGDEPALQATQKAQLAGYGLDAAGLIRASRELSRRPN